MTRSFVLLRMRGEALQAVTIPDPFLGTIMCYGQTGAGKTYTMTGATNEYKHRGIIPRAIQQVLDPNARRNNETSLVSALAVTRQNVLTF